MTSTLPLDQRPFTLPAAAPRAPGIVAGARLTLPAHCPPWQPTGIRVRTGDAYSVFALGRVQWAPGAPTLYGGPRFHLWCRVRPGGRIRNLRADTDTFVADVDGELEVGLYMGMWRDAQGTLATDPALYARLHGQIDVLLLCWGAQVPADALAALAGSLPDTCYAAELQHLRHLPPEPAGWQPLLETGESHLFTPSHTASGAAAIRINGEDEQGILCRPCDIPLSPATRLSWAWRLHGLPSAVAENSVRAHDYISLAAEFDNGRDLTWFWSTCLPPGEHFDCPVKYWSARETHLVARSGLAGLGTWQREERAVWRDVERAMGPPPGRIVRVWLIAVASFQHGRLHAEFSDIEISDGAHHWRLL